MPDDEFYKNFLIKEFKYWKAYIHPDQYYLGRCYLWSKKEGVKDFYDLSREELEEFICISKMLRDALSKLFKPDLFNYSVLRNISPHLHGHIIPRYKEEREFEGVKFFDENFGQSMIPVPSKSVPEIKNKDFNVSEEVVLKIREAIENELQQFL